MMTNKDIRAKNGKNFFMDIFNMSMREVGEIAGVSTEYVSQIFRVRMCSERRAKQIIKILEEARDKNYKAEIEMAEYRKARATEVIEEIRGIGMRERHSGEWKKRLGGTDGKRR